MVDTKKDLVSEYIDVNDVETHVLKYGSIRSLQSRQKEPQHLFLIIPGNPGIAEYYEQFMHTLWAKSGQKIPVWCISHAGHVTGPKHAGLGWTDIVRQPGPTYTLEGQISHKVNFIKNNVPQDVTLILIGHSIGCYIIMNLLPEIPEFNTLRCFMLFPTIEHMAETPNGKLFTPVLTYLRWTLTWLVKLFSYLGPKLQHKMLQYHFWDNSVPECGVQASMNLFNPACVNHCTYMAKIEMYSVGKLQEDLLKKYLHKMSFYYGAVDRWCPKELCYRMQAKFPEADIRLCQMDYSHAFVLDAGEEMAHLVWDWVGPHL
ncbi:lipid droplet-associated hydrolase-like isoform X2 [Babylonia areolata]